MTYQFTRFNLSSLVLICFFIGLGSHSPQAWADALLVDTGGATINVKTASGRIAKVKEGDIVATGTQIQLRKGQYATLSFSSGLDVLLLEESDSKVSNEGSTPLIELLYGELRGFNSAPAANKAGEKVAGSKIYIRTPSAAVAARGADFVVSNDRTSTEVHSLNGTVNIGPEMKDLAADKGPARTRLQTGEAIEKHTLGAQLKKSKFKPAEFLKSLEARRGLMQERRTRAPLQRDKYQRQIKALGEARQSRSKSKSKSQSN